MARPRKRRWMRMLTPAEAEEIEGIEREIAKTVAKIKALRAQRFVLQNRASVRAFRKKRAYAGPKTLKGPGPRRSEEPGQVG